MDNRILKCGTGGKKKRIEFRLPAHYLAATSAGPESRGADMRRGDCALSWGAFALLWLVAGFPLVPAASAATARHRIPDSAVSIHLVETQRLPKEALHATPQPCLPGTWVPGTDDFLIAGSHRFSASGARKLFLWNTRTHRVTQLINVPAIVKILNKGLGGRKDFAARGRAKPGRSNGWGLGGLQFNKGKLVTIFQNTIGPAPIRNFAGQVPPGITATNRHPNPFGGNHDRTTLRVLAWRVERNPFRVVGDPVAGYAREIESDSFGDGCQILIPSEGPWFAALAGGEELPSTASGHVRYISFPIAIFDIATGRRFAEGGRLRSPPWCPFASPTGSGLGWLAQVVVGGGPGLISGDNILRFMPVSNARRDVAWKSRGHRVTPRKPHDTEMIRVRRIRVPELNPMAILRQATFSPHGGRIFVIAQLPFSANVRSGRSEIAEVSPVTGRVTRMLALGPPGAALAPTISPDGRLLAVWLLHQDRRKHLHFRLLLLDTSTLKVIASCRAPRDVITGLYFSPTGTKIAAVGNKAIYLFQIGFH